MAYDAPGFRQESDHRGAPAPYQQGSYSVSDYASDTSDATLGGGRRGLSSAALDDVFDDPDHGEPGRDRMGVHVVWEMLLLLGVAALGFLLWRRHPETLRETELRTLLVFAAALGLMALAAGLSLRAAVPNLAVGPVAVAGALFYAKEGDKGVVSTTGVALVFALGLGILLAFLVVGFQVPAWAASLVGAFVAIVWIQRHTNAVDVIGGYVPTRHAYYLFGGFAALAVMGGLVGSIKTVRRALGRFRPIGDPARRRGGFAGALAGCALIGSTVLAAAGGVMLATYAGVSDLPVAPTSGLELTGLAMGAALLGGTSAFGRRGGIFGTLLAVILLGLFLRFERAAELKISWFAIAAALVAGGLVVTRLVESLGRPRPREGDDESDDTWMSSGGTQPLAGSTWSAPRQDWSSSLPAQPSGGRVSDLWPDDRWGSRS